MVAGLDGDRLLRRLDEHITWLARLGRFATFAEFARRGRTDVSLGVDAANETGATELYGSVGMHVALQWDVFERTLRAG